ncbi:MAG: hypothetical protein H6722_16505 [Sandaracinus sp.]|nr:hypothetical protein [Sandaracinus sp.]MCB9614043.1 hypothetical protein [Sandaracinus sp.]MCB9620654.1 hypothetical protein [Sandaracinus sp.]
MTAVSPARATTARSVPSTPRPTPLNRETALASESHRHELLDPATLRWVAQLLSELDGVPTTAMVGHLEAIASTAGAQLEVRWRREETKRSSPTERTTPGGLAQSANG